MDAGDSGPHAGLKTLTAYHRGALPPAEREALQEHLSLCSRCTRLLLELRNFEAAARGEAGPEPLREEAWEALVRRLPPLEAARPAASSVVRHRARRIPRAALAAAAALVAAVLGMVLWPSDGDRPERRPPAAERAPVLSSLQISLAEAERRNAMAGGGAWENGWGAAAPRFLRRGEEAADGGLLRGGGVVNRVRPEPAGRRITVLFSLAGHPAFPEYRFGLVDREGTVLWVGRRPARSVLGPDGTSLSIAGPAAWLEAGLYRLRVEGLRPDGADLLAEYLLAVEPG